MPVGDAWGTAEPEPVADVEAYLNGIDGAGADPETVMGSGYKNHDAETRRSLSSWREFLAGEPVKRRDGKPKPPSLSHFEWALTAEQEREEPKGG